MARLQGAAARNSTPALAEATASSVPQQQPSTWYSPAVDGTRIPNEQEYDEYGHEHGFHDGGRRENDETKENENDVWARESRRHYRTEEKDGIHVERVGGASSKHENASQSPVETAPTEDATTTAIMEEPASPEQPGKRVS